MAGVVDLLAPGFLIGAGKLDFEVFTDMHGPDALVAHVFEGVLHGFALRIEDRLFGSDNDFCFHLKQTGAQPGLIRGGIVQGWAGELKVKAV
jgi:hypothetical protein